MSSAKELQVLLKHAHYCDMAERHLDMIDKMKKAVKICVESKIEINPYVRNLLSLAYKNLISTKRSSWRVLYAEKTKLEEKDSEDVYIVDEYLNKIEKELIGYCDEILDLVDEFILNDVEAKPVAHNAFFYKMKGDYYRYKAEVLTGAEENKSADKALKSYLESKKYADTLNSTDPIRLGLYLNFSVFNYEILEDAEAACEIARSAFNSAISELDKLSEDSYRDSTLIMQLLRDNLSLWSDKQDNQGKINDSNE